MKGKTKRFLVVVVKWSHRANGPLIHCFNLWWCLLRVFELSWETREHDQTKGTKEDCFSNDWGKKILLPSGIPSSSGHIFSVSLVSRNYSCAARPSLFLGLCTPPCNIRVTSSRHRVISSMYFKLLLGVKSDGTLWPQLDNWARLIEVYPSLKTSAWSHNKYT